MEIPHNIIHQIVRAKAASDLTRSAKENIAMEMRPVALVALLILSTCCNSAVLQHGRATEFPSGNPQTATGREPSPGVYLAPNEQHPAVGLPIYSRSNHGVYVSVGTERSFLGAALTRAKALVVVDYDAEVILFAKINRALLAASRGREDYIMLRLEASSDAWLQRAATLPGEDRKTLSDPNSWRFWDDKVRKNLGAWDGAFRHFHTRPESTTDPFAASNYLFNDALYKHLHYLATKSLIWARLLDLRHEGEVRALCTDLRSKGLPLGFVDTSNVQDASEAGISAASQYIKWFSEYSQDSTIFMNTERANRMSVNYWSYFAFTNKVIKGHDARTIAQWYEKEVTKLSADPEMRAVIDDPDAIDH